MTKPDPLTPAAETLETLNDRLRVFDTDFDALCKARNELDVRLEHIKSDRDELRKRIISTHKDALKALESRKTRSDSGIPRGSKKTEAAKQ